MASQHARGLGYHPPTVETESEASDVSDTSSDEETTSSDEEEEEEEEEEEAEQTPPPQPTPANVGTKRSDPSIVQKKNKYATSDSGYSSLTATTASSSQSRKATEQPSRTDKLKQKLAQTLGMPTKTTASTTPRPMPSRRPSQRHERSGHELRSVESREEAARMSLGGSNSRIRTIRRPSESAAQTMPGEYPPSPKAASRQIAQPISSVPIARPRASTSTQASSARPKSYHAGSAPVTYRLASIVPGGQHFVINSQQQPQHHYPPQTHVQPQPQHQPLYINTATAYAPIQYAGSYNSPASWMPPSTTDSPYTPSHPYTPGTSQPYWNAGQAGFNAAPNDYYEAQAQSRRMSLSNSTMPGYPYQQTQHYYAEPQQPFQYPQLRRMSQSVQPTQSMFQRPSFRPPSRDEGVFFDEEEDPANFYRDFVGAMDREMMPPPPRPASAHRPRPPMIHARTTSAAHSAKRLSRGSMEYVPEVSPREGSFEAGRPPSRPGMQRYATTSGRGPRLLNGPQTVNQEPPSPVRQRHRPSSIYGQGDYELRTQAAEQYQHDRTGGFNAAVASDDIPLSRKATKTSESGSRGSRGSGSRESSEKLTKRTNRHSLDKSKLRDSQQPGVSLDIGNVRLDLKGGSHMTIKQSGEKHPTASTGSSRPASTKPTRESSRIRSERPEPTRYMSGSTSTRSSKDKENGEMEVARKRRSSSVQPRTGREDEYRDVTDAMRRLRMDAPSRHSRRSSRSSRAVIDG